MTPEELRDEIALRLARDGEVFMDARGEFVDPDSITAGERVMQSFALRQREAHGLSIIKQRIDQLRAYEDAEMARVDVVKALQKHRYLPVAPGPGKRTVAPWARRHYGPQR